MNDVQVYEGGGSLTALDIRKQVNLVQEVMKAVMIGPTQEKPEGVHYGIVPGTKKPTLLDPGAQKLMMTFRLGAEYEELSGTVESEAFILYKIDCKLFHIPTGNMIGHGRGLCSSREKKYKSRFVYPNKATPEEKAIGREEERQGRDGPYKVLVIPQDPWDLANTLYKMACKRARIAAVLNATAAGDIFTQDVEDLPEGTIIEEGAATPAGKPPVAMPQERKNVQDADATVYSDIMDLAKSELKAVLNVAGYFISASHKQYPQRNDKKKMTDVTSYVVGDLAKDPSAQITIKTFGTPIEITVGAPIRFNEVTVGEYSGSKDYMAKEVLHG